MLAAKYIMITVFISSPETPETSPEITGDTITKEEESILRFGLKHGLATRPKETDVIAAAESIWHQLKKENLLPDSYTKQQKIKHSIKALACNILDFDDKRLYDDHKRIKILRNMNEKYAILKPDKGSGVVLLLSVSGSFSNRISDFSSNLRNVVL